MEKVLIAIDYNPTSEKVVNRGYELAKTLGAEICLLHVVADFSYYGMQYPSFMGFDSYEIPLNPNVYGEIIKIAENFLAKAVDHLNDASVTTHIEEGETADAILKYAQEYGASIIVLGTHSHSKLEKVLMGTVTSKVIEHTQVPVFMVPTKVH